VTQRVRRARGKGPSGVPALGEPETVVGVVFGCRPQDVAEDVIVTPFVPLKGFRRQVEGELLELSPPFFYKGFTATFGGRKATVIATGVGPSQVGDCLGFLSLTPARRVLFAGAVGGLAEDQAIGEFFLPLEAADGEGFTRYLDRPFREVVRRARRIPRPHPCGEDLSGFLTRKGFPVREGRVFTVGSIASESPENLQELRSQGYDAIDMELSAFYSAALHYGLSGAALTYISDLPLRSSLWQEKGPKEQEALRRAYRALPLLALEYFVQGECVHPENAVSRTELSDSSGPPSA
jgi:purine-nucleoside phosphorylase